jgi:hypothetical protein
VLNVRSYLGLLVVVLVTIVACSPAPPLEEEATGETTPPPEDEGPDPELIALSQALDGARDELETVLAALSEGAETGDDARVREAVALLTASPDLRSMAGTDDAGADGFLPADEPAEDTLSRLLALARDAADTGTQVATVLQDPVAGDTTTWQRRPEDRNAAIASAAEAGDEATITELEGHLPRAVAWAVAASRTTDVTGAAERAAAHTAVALTAIDRLADEVAALVE